MIPSLQSQSSAVLRALKAAPDRTSADKLHCEQLAAASLTLQRLAGLTADQIEFITTDRGKSLIRAAWDARDKPIEMRNARRG
jgi:hypothetical protein